MSIQTIINLLGNLIKLHKQFNQFAIEKTEILKKNDMPALNELLKKETALIKQLKKLEQERRVALTNYLKEKGMAIENVTMDQLIEISSEEEQSILKKLQKGLLAEIDQLKKQNELNQQLLEDSLRFVNFSLDLIAPDFSDVNYTHPNQKAFEEGASRSLFDSKA